MSTTRPTACTPREECLPALFAILSAGEWTVIRLAVQNALREYERKNMKSSHTVPKNINEYIAAFPQDVQEILEKIRLTIRRAAPDAEETIRYRIPTFTLKGNLVHFGAFKKHIGFYPASTGVEKFRNELSKYEGARGTVRFPFEEPIPFTLIGRIVTFRVKENLERAAAKAQAKKTRHTTK